MACFDSISGFARTSALFAALLGLACQQLPQGADIGSGGDDGDDDGGSTSGDTGSDDEESSASADDDGDATGNDDGNPTLDCDPVAQTGCNPDEKCTAIESAGEVTYTCVADTDDLDPFSPCTPALASGMDGCPPGYACFGDEEDNGVCLPLCLDHGDCEDALCVAPPTTDATFCGSECSPFESLCPASMQCRRVTDRFVCNFPRTSDVGGQAEECFLDGDGGCGEGFVCLPGELVPGCTSGTCCTAVCDTTLPDSCDSPSLCSTLFETPAPGAETFGACYVPS